MAARIRRTYWISLITLAAALFTNYLAGNYVSVLVRKSLPLRDFFLNVLPATKIPFLDLGVIFTWGFLMMLVFAGAATWIYEQKNIPFILFCCSVMILMRSLSMIMTPLQSPPGKLQLQGYFLYDHIGYLLTFDHDLFFSMHAALPFMFYLTCRTRWLRMVFLGISLIFGWTVLAGRFHYSVDVLSAYFYGYGAQAIARRIFHRLRIFRGLSS